MQGCRLNDGDEIALGKFRLRFSVEGGPPVSSLSEAGGAPASLATDNPEHTTAISLVDLQRMAEQQEAQRSVRRPVAKARQKSAPNRTMLFAVVGLAGLVVLLSVGLLLVVLLR